MRCKANYQNAEILKEQIAVARGLTRAALVVKNVSFLDVFRGEFVEGDVAIHRGHIVGTCESYQGETEVDGRGLFLVPGFIDAHVHIESSLMTPRRFAEAVLPLGTTTALWDPHEIANVLGSEGIAWALAASEDLPMDIFLMVPSCVPSTSVAAGLETSGAELCSEHLAPFRTHPRVLGLAELMNYPGLLNGEDDVLAKLMLFAGQKRDGHCPGLSGRDLNAYGVAGIMSCHESTSAAEAVEKLKKGLHVLIREGSCAKNAESLLPLLDAYSSAVLCLCSDDRNPADIAREGHLNAILLQGLRMGKRPADLFRAASFAPARAYGLDDRGAIAPGYRADFCLLRPTGGSDWQHGFEISAVYKDGKRFAATSEHPSSPSCLPLRSDGRNLRLSPVKPEFFTIQAAADALATGQTTVKLIEVLPGQILTEACEACLLVGGQGEVYPSLDEDVLKITVIERHHNSGRHATAFVRGFQLKEGAIATSINHDCHNVIVVGASDEAMAEAVNRLIAIDGGIVVWRKAGESSELPLPIGGLMTDEPASHVAEALARLKALAASMGCTLDEPFLQLSFLALPVIPKLKITDRGLVDVHQFKIVPLTGSFAAAK